MKIRMNPIVKKDLQVTARSMKLSWGLFAYEAVLTCAFLLALVIIQVENRSIYSDNIYGQLVYLFPVLAVAQLCIVALIMPILTASSISGEKERQTFDIMLTTCMSPMSIVIGKVTAAVIRILFFVLASFPIMALAFVAGGLGWENLLWFLLALTMLAVFSGSIGIFCSAICNKAIAAVILSFVFYFVIYAGTCLPMIIHLLVSDGKFGESLLFLLFNPFLFFIEFFTNMMTGRTLLQEARFSTKDVGALTYALTRGKAWMVVSVICILALSLLFMWGAAWKVNPLHSSGGRKPVKKKGD